MYTINEHDQYVNNKEMSSVARVVYRFARKGFTQVFTCSGFCKMEDQLDLDLRTTMVNRRVVMASVFDTNAADSAL